MTRWLAPRLDRFGRDTDGAALIEFSVVVILFFFGMFAVVDFGRLAFTGVGTETAVRLAARIAVARPPACAGVPDRNVRSIVAPPIRHPAAALRDLVRGRHLCLPGGASR